MNNSLKQRWLLFLLMLFFVPSLTFADTTSTLRPDGDGSEDVITWVNESATTCDTTDCYLSIDESAGGSCSDSDGGTTYINSDSAGSGQTFDIDESSIPDGSTITQIDITTCHVKDGASGGTFQTRYCLDDTCSSSGSDISVGAAYTETSQSIPLSYTKISGSDIEIGVIDINTARTVTISQISAVLTYTLSSDATPPSDISDLAATTPTSTTIDLDWTSPGDDGSTGTATTYDIRYSTSVITDSNFTSATEVTGEPTPSVFGTAQSMTVTGLSSDTTYYFAMETSDEASNASGVSNVVNLSTSAASTGSTGSGGSGVTPTMVNLSGLAYPSSTIEVLRKGSIDEIYRNIPLEDVVVNDDGSFSATYIGLLGSDYFFALRIIDKDNRETGIMSFTVDLLNEDLVVDDLFVPPTISLNSESIRRGMELVLEGYATPSNQVILEFSDGEIIETTSNEDGYWKTTSPTETREGGSYSVRVKQVSEDERESDFSRSTSFKVSKLLLPSADFNEDETIDIIDWSIFLFRWDDEESFEREVLDFNNDGTINIVDFSIFLNSFII